MGERKVWICLAIQIRSPNAGKVIVSNVSIRNDVLSPLYTTTTTNDFILLTYTLDENAKNNAPCNTGILMEDAPIY